MPSINQIVLVCILVVTILVVSLILKNDDTNVTADDDEDWPMFQLYYNHSATKSGDAPDTDDMKWVFDSNNTRWIVSSPMIVDEYVYIGSDDGNLYKLYFNNGTIVWNYTTSSAYLASFWSSPCVDKENNMVFAHANGLHAVDMTTGEQIWYFETSEREFSSPVVYDGVVFIGSFDQHVYALDEFTGDVIWYYEAGEYEFGQKVEGTGGAVSTTLAITDTMVFGAEQTTYSEEGYYCDYNIFALPREDPNTNGVIEHGEILWKYEIGEHLPLIDFGVPLEGGESFSSPTVNEELGQVYIGSRDMYFYCFAIEPEGDGLDNDGDGIFDNEGELIWRFAADNEIFPTASYRNGTIFFGSGTYSTDNPGSMYALLESDGSMVWRYRNSDGFLSSPLIADGKVFIGANDDRMYVFNETDGIVLWEYHVQEGGSTQTFGSSPALYEGTVIIGCCNGFVYAFGEPEDDGSGSGGGDDDEEFLQGSGEGILVAGLFVVILVLVILVLMKRKDKEYEEVQDDLYERTGEEQEDVEEGSTPDDWSGEE